MSSDKKIPPTPPSPRYVRDGAIKKPSNPPKSGK